MSHAFFLNLFPDVIFKASRAAIFYVYEEDISVTLVCHRLLLECVNNSDNEDLSLWRLIFTKFIRNSLSWKYSQRRPKSKTFGISKFGLHAPRIPWFIFNNVLDFGLAEIYMDRVAITLHIIKMFKLEMEISRLKCWYWQNGMALLGHHTYQLSYGIGAEDDWHLSVDTVQFSSWIPLSFGI